MDTFDQNHGFISQNLINPLMGSVTPELGLSRLRESYSLLQIGRTNVLTLFLQDIVNKGETSTEDLIV